MACSVSDLILRIRRTLHDANLDKPLYSDDIYQDNIRKALIGVSIDLCLMPTLTLDTLTPRYEYLVELLATMWVSMVRGGEAASTDVEDQPIGPTQSVTVPNLSVYHIAQPLEGPRFWKKLADDTKLLYDKAIEGCLDANSHVDASIVTVSDFVVMDNKTQRLTKVLLAYPPDSVAVSLLLNPRALTEVIISWNTIRDTHFSYYRVFRSINSDMFEKEQIASISNNHLTAITDEPGVGIWFYMVTVTNDTSLVTDSLIHTIEVV